jgi:hypothetical protein
MSYELVKDVYDDLADHIVFDTAFCSKLIVYYMDFVNKNENHILFFGGHLLGVYPVSFTDEDRTKWFNEILGVDELVLRPHLIKIPAINEEFAVSSDTWNLSAIWLLHRIYNEKKLPQAIKHNTMKHVAAILQCKFLTSLLSHYFKYQADAGKAEATYNGLSEKFNIKKYKTYGNYLMGNADNIVQRSWNYFDVIDTMRKDLRVVAALNGIQNGIRSMVKYIYGEFMKIHTSGTKYLSNSMVLEHDGSEMIKDKLDLSSDYGRYIKDIISDKNSFIKEELVKVILNLVPNMPERLFRLCLENTTKQYYGAGIKQIDDILDRVLVHAYDYFMTNKNILTDKTVDLADILQRLKGIYTSSRATDQDLKDLRKITEKFVAHAIDNKVSTNISSVRTGFLLYIMARTLTKHHYTTVI